MPARLPDEKRAAIAQAIADGGKCRAVARQFGVSPSTVSAIAREARIPAAFERAQTKNATRAREADMAERRTQLMTRWLDEMEHQLDRATQPYTMVVTGPAGPSFVTLKEPPLGEARSAITAAAVCQDKHMALVRHASEGGSDMARSMLGQLAAALGVAAAALDDGYTPPPEPESTAPAPAQADGG